MNPNYPFRCVIKPWNQVHQRGFADTGRAEDCKGFTRLRREADILEHLVALRIRVPEGDAVEHHLTGLWKCGACAVPNVRIFGKDIPNAIGGNLRTGEVHDEHGSHHQGEQDLRHIVQERHDLPHLDIPAAHLHTSEPDGQDDPVRSNRMGM